MASSPGASGTLGRGTEHRRRSRAAVKSAAVSVMRPAPDGGEGSFVDEVGQVGAGETGSGGGELVEVGAARQGACRG